ncbi:MAG: ketopantoate reductase family protein [Roseiflexaceae bacterium]|nr:ketopantoate reductase family protein [Roseiflexaceae bacterium]
MNITIIGAGAIGLLVAARLAESGGNRVALLARSNAPQLAAAGIALHEAGATRHVHTVEVFADPSTPPFRPELAVLCVKGYDTEGVLPALDAIGAAFVLTLQNGIGHEERLIAHYGPARVISGAITTSVEVDGPAGITVTKSGGIGIAPIGGPPVDHVAQPFARAGFETRVVGNYAAMKWSKALLNMLGNASAAILDMSVADVYADDRLVALERRAFLEALAVMDKRGLRPVNLPRYPAAPLAQAMRFLPAPLLYAVLRRTVAGGRGGKLPSLLIELRRGNPRSEGAFLYGAVAEEAVRVGVAAPVNAALWRTLHGIASGSIAWDEYRHKPDRLLQAASQPSS